MAGHTGSGAREVAAGNRKGLPPSGAGRRAPEEGPWADVWRSKTSGEPGALGPGRRLRAPGAWRALIGDVGWAGVGTELSTPAGVH